MWKDDKKENAASLHMPVDYWLMSCSICYFSAKDTDVYKRQAVYSSLFPAETGNSCFPYKIHPADEFSIYFSFS